MQELAAILAPQNRIQGRCALLRKRTQRTVSYSDSRSTSLHIVYKVLKRTTVT